MKHIFITYGDSGYDIAKAKIVSEAKATGVFQEIYSYGRENLSDELLSSEIINIKRGGGLWSWKPDILLSTMLKHEKGDIVVYCDAGCTLYPSKEWNQYWNKLKDHDIIAQKIFARTEWWTRKELIDAFSSNGTQWLSSPQFQATIILKISDFTIRFVREWRDLMIYHPEYVMDVPDEEKELQHCNFVESRHDQSIYSALIYKYLSDPEFKQLIYTQWEHVEDYDFFCKQAIRATRLRQGQTEGIKHLIQGGLKRMVKDFVVKPLYLSDIYKWDGKK